MGHLAASRLQAAAIAEAMAGEGAAAGPLLGMSPAPRADADFEGLRARNPHWFPDTA